MTWYTGDPVFDTVLAVGLAFAVVTLLGSIFVPAPYGRFAQGSGVNLHPKLGWWLMEIPATVVFLFFFLQSSPEAWTTTTLVLAGIWLLHYGNRGWFFPLAIRAAPGARSSFSLMVMAMGMFVTAIHGYLHAMWFTEYGNHLTPEWLTDPRFVIGLAIYALGLFLILTSESVMRHLRPPNPAGRRTALSDPLWLRLPLGVQPAVSRRDHRLDRLCGTDLGTAWRHDPAHHGFESCAARAGDPSLVSRAVPRLPTRASGVDSLCHLKTVSRPCWPASTPRRRPWRGMTAPPGWDCSVPMPRFTIRSAHARTAAPSPLRASTTPSSRPTASSSKSRTRASATTPSWRDVTIHTHMATGLSLRVPAHLRYQLRAQPSGPCYIRRLCAHWELGSMLGQSLRSGWLGLRSNAGLTRHLLACQGMTGAIGFTRGLGGVGRRGRGRAERLFTALRDGDKAAASAQCSPQPTFHVDGASLASIDALIEHARGLQWRKLIAAGRQVTASIETASGHGIALLTFDKRGRVVQLRWEF